MNFLTKLILYFKKSPVIIVIGENKQSTTETILLVLKKYFKVKKFQKNPSFSDILRLDILIFEADREDFKNFEFFLKKSSKPVIIITDSETQISVEQILKVLPSSCHLILNFDNKIKKIMKEKTNFQILTFNFQSAADFWASDVKINDGINFKINYKGNFVPFWLDTFDKKKILSALVATSIGIIFNINLVEISEALKEYK